MKIPLEERKWEGERVNNVSRLRSSFAKQSPFRLLGWGKISGSNEYGLKKSSSENILARTKSPKAMGRRESHRLSGSDNGKETKGQSVSDEEERNGRDGSGTANWRSKQRKHLTPSIQVVKCSIKGNQAEM